MRNIRETVYGLTLVALIIGCAMLYLLSWLVGKALWWSMRFLLLALWPVRWIGKRLWQLDTVHKICIVLAVLSAWFFSRLKIEPIKLSMPTLSPVWLIALGAALLLILIIVWLMRGQGSVSRKKNRAATENVSVTQPVTKPSDPPWPPVKPVYVWQKKKRVISAVGLIFLAIGLSFLIYLTFWEQIFQTVKWPGRGDGAVTRVHSEQIETISPGYYRVHLPADTGWYPTLNFWPGDQIIVTIEQPSFFFVDDKGDTANVAVTGVVLPEDMVRSRGHRLATPEDDRPGKMFDYIDQLAATYGLLLKAGDNGLKRYCGDGGYYTIPGGIDRLTGSHMVMLYFAINIRQTRWMRDHVHGKVIFTIRIVHSDHPIK